MAKVIEDVVVIKFSSLVKDTVTDPDVVLSNDNIKALEQVAQELVGNSVVVEVVRA